MKHSQDNPESITKPITRLLKLYINHFNDLHKNVLREWFVIKVLT